MKITTLCYIENNNQYLMLHRVKKQNDINQGKWIGVGGHAEGIESPEECLVREVREETGLELLAYRLRGVITFVTDTYPTEYMFLYTATEFAGTMITCDEGDLEWIPVQDVERLPIWEGDKVFFRLLREQQEFFSQKLRKQGETLKETTQNRQPK